MSSSKDMSKFMYTLLRNNYDKLTVGVRMVALSTVDMVEKYKCQYKYWCRP